jgi:hypothetical protein
MSVRKVVFKSELFFSLEQHEAIREMMKAIAPPLEFERTISSAGRKESVSIPKDIVRFMRLKVGTPIRIYGGKEADSHRAQGTR